MALLTQEQYDSLVLTHVGASKTEAYGDAEPGESTLCGDFRPGEEILNLWSFRSVAKHFSMGRRPCKACLVQTPYW